MEWCRSNGNGEKELFNKVFDHDDKCKLWGRFKTARTNGSGDGAIQAREMWDGISGKVARSGKRDEQNQMLLAYVGDPTFG
eukprot:7838423-Lingulodinium_polyedra.AAC.1